jgi:hypothetical protein
MRKKARNAREIFRCAINVGLPCESKPNFGEGDPSRRFANQKAQFYQELADAFEHSQVEGLNDEETIGQLAGIPYKIDSQGRVKIESKEAARACGVMSPDRAEALMLALCKPPQKFEYYSIRDQMRSGSSELPYDDDDDDYRSPRSRRWDGWAPGSLARELHRNKGCW